MIAPGKMANKNQKRLIVHRRRGSEQRYRALNAALELKVQERTRDLRDANAELHRLATTDSLTGVWNHVTWSRPWWGR